jgi:hypothetical protein
VSAVLDVSNSPSNSAGWRVDERPSDGSGNFDRPLTELLDAIDFEAIADHWLARFSGYRRREIAR